MVLTADRLLIAIPKANGHDGISWSSSYLIWTSFIFSCQRKKKEKYKTIDELELKINESKETRFVIVSNNRWHPCPPIAYQRTHFE